LSIKALEVTKQEAKKNMKQENWTTRKRLGFPLVNSWRSTFRYTSDEEDTNENNLFFKHQTKDMWHIL